MHFAEARDFARKKNRVNYQVWIEEQSQMNPEKQVAWKHATAYFDEAPPVWMHEQSQMNPEQQAMWEQETRYFDEA